MTERPVEPASENTVLYEATGPGLTLTTGFLIPGWGGPKNVSWVKIVLGGRHAQYYRHILVYFTPSGKRKKVATTLTPVGHSWYTVERGGNVEFDTRNVFPCYSCLEESREKSPGRHGLGPGPEEDKAVAELDRRSELFAEMLAERLAELGKETPMTQTARKKLAAMTADQRRARLDRAVERVRLDAECLAENDPVATRLVCLWACAVCRRLPPSARSVGGDGLLDTAERLADGVIPVAQFWDEGPELTPDHVEYACTDHEEFLRGRGIAREDVELSAEHLAGMCGVDVGWVRVFQERVRDQGDGLIQDALVLLEGARILRVRRPRPAWNPEWNTAQAVAVASALYHDRLWEDPLTRAALADALEDAGVDDPLVFEPLRACPEAWPLCRGFWVTDAVLGLR